MEKDLEQYEQPEIRDLGSVQELTQTTIIPKSLSSDDGTALQSGQTIGS